MSSEKLYGFALQFATMLKTQSIQREFSVHVLFPSLIHQCNLGNPCDVSKSLCLERKLGKMWIKRKGTTAAMK